MNEERRPSVASRRREEERRTAIWLDMVEAHGAESTEASVAIERATDVTVELDMLYDLELDEREAAKGHVCVACQWSGDTGHEAHIAVVHPGSDLITVEQMGRTFIVHQLPATIQTRAIEGATPAPKGGPK